MTQISIIIPTYQEGRVISKTIQSILAQTFQDFEIIIVDDGSTDDTEDQVRPFFDRVRYFKRPHIGNQPTRNFGLQEASGEYVIVCDADIHMRPDCLEKMLSALEKNPASAFAYSGFRWGWKKFPSFPFDVERLKAMNYINMASLVRRSLHPGFDEAIGRFQDWDVWLSIVERGGKGVFIPEVLFSIGEHRGGISMWLPKYFYRIPWEKLGIRIKNVDSYEHWKKIIQKKHRIEM
ncbi:glycosyltransferase family 2 protein [Candidatus Uhrbacteria bacterium]|nr:glycosyltransferase family 2 protein [Candidatus Uhrbacteria bacterium]